MAPAFIVDGVLEKRVIERLCKGRPVRRTEMNGRDVQLDAIARTVSTLIEAFSDDHYPIVIIVDREGRDISSESMEAKLYKLLENYGHSPANLIISCPDRMIENWVCAGSTSYEGGDICLDEERSFDDMNGKAHLRKELGKLGVTYRETTIGVKMFCEMDGHRASDRSESFRRLSQRLHRLCWFFDRSNA